MILFFKKYCWWFFVCLILCFIKTTQAEPLNPPHSDPNVKTGFIEGKLFTQNKEGKKIFLSDHRVILVVFYQGERILMLDKTTDTQGFFKFTNIFQDPDYSYALVSMLDDSLYVISGIGLEQGEESKNVDLWVGPGSPYFMADVSNMEVPSKSPMQQGSMGLVSSQKAEYSVSARWAKSYQQIALILSAVVVILVILFAFSKTKIKS